MGYIQSLLEPFLEQFSLSSTALGLSFLPMSLSYYVATPLSGSISDSRPWTVCTLGLLTSLASFTFLGPAAYIPAGPSYPATLASLAGCGAGIAAVLVASYSATR